jgi:hypothetical protein
MVKSVFTAVFRKVDESDSALHSTKLSNNAFGIAFAINPENNAVTSGETCFDKTKSKCRTISIKFFDSPVNTLVVYS